MFLYLGRIKFTLFYILRNKEFLDLGALGIFLVLLLSNDL